MRGTADFVRQFFAERLSYELNGRIRGDAFARLQLTEGRIDPYPLYDRIRAAGPLSRSRLGVHVTADHTVCHEVLRHRGLGVDRTVVDPGDTPALSFLEMNPPDHTRLRRLAAPTFSPRGLSRLEPMIDQVLTELHDRMEPGRPFDLIAGLAAPMPIAVISELLGIGDADADAFARYGAALGSALGGIQSLPHVGRLLSAREQLSQIFTRVFEEKRRDPGDDLISELVATEGDRIKPEELIPFCTLLLIAGFETTVNLIGNTVLALLNHPDSWHRVVEDPTLAAAAVEETLRYDPPVQRTWRITLSEVELAGQLLPRDAQVEVLIGGSGRDPLVFPDPDRFDLDRPNRHDHLAFSGGIHYCVGAPLARFEATLAVRAVAERFPRLAMITTPTRRSGSLIRGLATLPVLGYPAGRPARAH